MDYLLVFACFYFAYDEIKALVNYGNQPWHLVHYLLLALAIVLIGMGLWRSFVMYKQWKYKKEHPEEDEAPKGADALPGKESDAPGEDEDEGEVVEAEVIDAEPADEQTAEEAENEQTADAAGAIDVEAEPVDKTGPDGGAL